MTLHSLLYTSTEDDWGGCSSPEEYCALRISGPFAHGDDYAAFRPELSLKPRGEIILGPAETREEGCSVRYRAARLRGKTSRQRFVVHHIATTLATLKRVRGKDGKQVLFAIDAFEVNGMVQYTHATQSPSADYKADYVQCSKLAPYEYKITSRFPDTISMLAAEEELIRSTDWGDPVPF
jgi:hypothetical protein